MTEDIHASALFDSPRKAVSFALNHRIGMARPAMNKAADGARLELADGTVLRAPTQAPKASKSERSAQLRGMDGVAQAGMILQHLARLPDAQQLVLIASSIPPDIPCHCGSLCCSGGRPNAPWVKAVVKLCDHLRDEAQLSRVPGKKGLGTSPYLRRMLVEKFFIPGKEIVLARIAERIGVTETTVINHKRPIVMFLEKQERAAWRAIDESLGEAGIVGDTR